MKLPDGRDLKHYCYNCNHYITDHVKEEFLEYCANALPRVPMTQYISGCEKDGCSCTEFEHPQFHSGLGYKKDDEPPTPKETIEYKRKEAKLNKIFGIPKISSVRHITKKLNKKAGINREPTKAEMDFVLENLKDMQSRGEAEYDKKDGWKLTRSHVNEMRGLR